MIYILAYVGFAITFLVGISLDSNFKNSWVKNIIFLVVFFVLGMKIAGIA